MKKNEKKTKKTIEQELKRDKLIWLFRCRN